MVGSLDFAPEAWAERHFSSVSLGDRRRTRRAVKLATEMARQPGASVPAQAGAWSDVKASYRLFDCEDVTFASLVEPHRTQTREQAARASTVLMIQDTTELDFSQHRAQVDLGPIGNGGGQGFVLHSTLAVDPSDGGDVLGLASQILFCRDGIKSSETRAARKRRPRESQLWCQSVEAVGGSSSPARWVHVCDRYGDFFELFDMCRRTGVDFLIRMAQDRRCSAGHDAEAATGHLMQWVRSLPATGQKTLSLRSRPGRKARESQLNLAYSKVTLFEPRLGRIGAAPWRGWVVRVWEPDPPAGEEPIEWVLLTSVAVDNVSDARRIIHWYSLRWLIEEYHKCLKTGCRVEDRQLETRRRLEACIGLLAVLAVRLLGLKLLARRNPEADVCPHVSTLHLQVLAAHRKRTTESLTAHEFWREVAKMGGFIGRKSDGEPGWQTLWRGWQRLDAMTLGAELFQNGVAKCG